MMFAHRVQSSEPIRGALVPALGWQAGLPAELSAGSKPVKDTAPKSKVMG